jgi:OmcA/MtrC family decaheme c-type cytochrome
VGPTGPTGPSGPPGEPPQLAEQCFTCHGPERLAAVADIHNLRAAGDLTAGLIQINTVTIPGTAPVRPVVDFTVYGPDCGPPGTPFAASSTCQPFDYQPVNGQPIEAFNFTVAKLAAAPSVGENIYWVPYLYSSSGAPTSERSCGTVTSSGVPTCAAGTGELVGTLTRVGTGHFTYTFAKDLSTVTAPGTTTPIIYDPAATTRFGIQTSNNQIFANGTNDVAGSLATPTIVSTQACNQCHKRLTIHGRRILEAYCVTCHAPALTQGGQSGNMAVMIHSWHAGKQLNLSYSFAGVVATEITYPQEVANCTTCHQDLSTSPATALNNWQTNPSFTACFTCHAVSSHPFAVTATNNCTTCHNTSATDKQNVAIAHNSADSIFADQQAANFQYRIISVANTAPGQNPVVTLAVVNPTTSPATTYDLKAATGPWSYTASGASRLFVDIAWQNADFRNAGNGVNVGQPISIDVLASGVFDTTNFSVAVTSATTVPSNLTGQLTVAVEGHPGVPNPLSSASTTTPLRIPVGNAVMARQVTGSSATARRAVVDVAKCNLCHKNLSLHGSNRTPAPPSAALPFGSVAVCAMCHNTEATDVSRRPTTGTGIDGKTQEAIDFKTMIHGIHSARIVVYGFGGNATDFRDVTYPAPLNNCQACHITPLEDQFPPSFTYSMPVTAAFGTTTDAGASLPDGTDNLRTTKWAATCLACHASPVFNSTADPFRTARNLDHVIVNGGGFGLTQAEIDALNQ